MISDSKAYIEEYKELRSEIRFYLDSRTKIIHLVVVLVAATVGAGIEIKSPSIFIVSALLISYLWYDNIRHLKAIQRLAAYLAIFVEPKIDGLNWETLGREHKVQTAFFERILANGLFPTIVLAEVSYGLFLADWDRLIKIMISGVFILFITTLISLSYIRIKKGHIIENEAWIIIKENNL